MIGEREALALAAEMPGAILSIDDGLARRYADILRVRFTGTAGVLAKAKQQGLLDAVAPVLDRLAALQFRLDTQTRAAVLRQAVAQEGRRPRGAQVRATCGVRLNPLSSAKTMVEWRARAPA